jgi:predicted ATPase/DNA-binding SARP family transcriptional activator
MSEGQWRISILGELQARYEQRMLHHLSMRRAGALLACLVWRAPQPVSREELLALLWPEDPADSARNRLRVLLNALRGQLETADGGAAPLLAAERHTVQLVPTAFTSDYHDFLSALQAAKTAADPGESAAELERALALYRGEFLTGFYDEWILAERTQIAELRYRALRDLTQRLIVLEAMEPALEYARQAVEAEPLDEEAHYDLMRLYASLGQPSAALRQYEQLQRLLQDTMQAPPAERIQQLATRIRTMPGPGVEAASRLIRPAARRDAAPAHSATPPGRNLPPRLTRFFGREPELMRLRALLAPGGDVRLVSLLGPGGAGKTRLAIEAAEQLQAAYEGRVYFVPLAEIAEPNRIGIMLANALRLPPAPGLDPQSQALAVLDQAPTLLVLDNLEQLLPEAALQIEHLLLEAAPLRCLITSRRSVGIGGEQEIPLEPLPQPCLDNSPEEMLACPGVALFVDRVQAIRSEFRLTSHNAADVAQLCRALEGLPLAIELAAARARVMSLGEMRGQADHLLNWLVDARGGKSTRHRSLRATLEWSYRLLTLEERRCFNALSLFAGGFTARAAGAVGLGHVEETQAALGMLEQLCAASLLRVIETEGGVTRFNMFETLREFGRERLVETGQETETCRRHLAYFAVTLWEQEQQPSARWTAEMAALISVEDDNMRQALEFGMRADVDSAEQEMALNLADRLAGYWELRGRWGEGRAYLSRAVLLPVSVGDDATRARVRRSAGLLAALMGDYEEARQLSLEGLKLARNAGDPAGIAGCLCNLGHIAHYQDDYNVALEHFRDALTLYQQAQNWPEVGACLISLGNTAFFLSDHNQAKDDLLEALTIYRHIADRSGAASALQRLGNVCRNQGYVEEAQTYLTEALAIFRDLHHQQGIAMCLHDLGLVARLQQDVALQQTRLIEALHIFASIGFQRGVNSCRLYLGEAAESRGDLVGARSLLSQVAESCRLHGERRNLAASLLIMGAIALTESRYDEARALLNEAEQTQQEIGNTAGIANCYVMLGRLALAQGDLAEAISRFSRALEIYRDTGVLPNILGMLERIADLAARRRQTGLAVRLLAAVSKLGRQIGLPQPDRSEQNQDLIALLGSELGPSAFATAWSEGEALNLAAAVSEALQFTAFVSL